MLVIEGWLCLYGRMNDDSGLIGFSWCLCLLFVVGKLCGVVGWGWLWVLSPLWVPVVLGLVVLLCYCILMIIGLALVSLFE